VGVGAGVVTILLLSADWAAVSGLVQLAFDEEAEQLEKTPAIGGWQAFPPTAR
jgi:hypothetical protein